MLTMNKLYPSLYNILDMFGGHCSPDNGTLFGVQSKNMDLQNEVFRETIE